MPRLCLLTPHPDYEENWHPDAQRLAAALGTSPDFRVWTDPGDLTGFDLIMPLLAWGYQRLVPHWFAALDAWEAQGLPFANPVSVLRWNTDKDYLLDLGEKGVAIVPTIETHSLTAADLDAARTTFGSERLVVKPSISAGADGTYLLNAGDAIPFDVREREMLIQPMMPGIQEEGEFSLFLFNGQLSHSIIKRPAKGDFRVQEQFGGREERADAPAGAVALAEAALAAAPALPLYARVDMVRDGQGHLRLMELELIEPSLFLQYADDEGAMFAGSVASVVG
jgi:glutathione synthase/RimK-type ligase-like ATP-grasp enzyme